jgi:hypothetical protein
MTQTNEKHDLREKVVDVLSARCSSRSRDPRIVECVSNILLRFKSAWKERSDAQERVDPPRPESQQETQERLENAMNLLHSVARELGPVRSDLARDAAILMTAVRRQALQFPPLRPKKAGRRPDPLVKWVVEALWCMLGSEADAPGGVPLVGDLVSLVLPNTLDRDKLRITYKKYGKAALRKWGDLGCRTRGVPELQMELVSSSAFFDDAVERYRRGVKALGLDLSLIREALEGGDVQSALSMIRRLDKVAAEPETSPKE